MIYKYVEIVAVKYKSFVSRLICEDKKKCSSSLKKNANVYIRLSYRVMMNPGLTEGLHYYVLVSLDSADDFRCGR